MLGKADLSTPLASSAAHPPPATPVSAPVARPAAHAPPTPATPSLALSAEASAAPASPALAQLDLTWAPWGDALSRQNTAESTVASEGDFRLPLAYSPHLPGVLEDSSRTRVPHRRRIALAFVIGFVSGASAAAVVALSLGRASAVPPPPGLAAAQLLNATRAPYALALPPSQVPTTYLAAAPLDNSCLLKGFAVPHGPRTLDACAFVVRSVDEVWNLRGDVDAAIEKYFHEGYVGTGPRGTRLVGRTALRAAVLSQMRAFPDIRVHISDCTCEGNDTDGYKCAMPDVLTGTNRGPSAYGPPTGRYARWTGTVQSLVKRNPITGQWQYYAEWGVHDEWSLVQQLGLDFSRVPHPPYGAEPLHSCVPLSRLGQGPVLDQAGGVAKAGQAVVDSHF